LLGMCRTGTDRGAIALMALKGTGRLMVVALVRSSSELSNLGNTLTSSLLGIFDGCGRLHTIIKRLLRMIPREPPGTQI